MVYLLPIFISEMLDNVKKHFPNETGGLIAGELISESKWAVTHITLPGNDATHRSHSYTPDYEHDENEIARIYHETECQSVYLGDWHSHPNSASYMSEKDKSVLRIIAKSKDARMHQPIMLILGTAPFELRCWTYRKSKLFTKEIVEIPIAISF